MPLSYQNLRDQSHFWFAEYVAPFSGIGWNTDIPADSLQMHIKLLDAYERGDVPVQEAVPYLTANLLLEAQLLQHLDKAPVTPPPFPSVPLSFPLPDTLAFAGLIPPEELIDFLYFGADFDGREILVGALHQNLVNPTALVSALLQVAQSASMPAAQLVLAQIHDQGDGALPDSGFAHADLDTDQLAFLAGLYIAAFGRAPEHEGLMYWADSLAGRLADGASQDDGYKAVTRDIHWSGERHGEAGTALDDAQYIEFVYASVLGRSPDAGGLAYWLDELHEGVSPRAEFLTVFLRAGLDAPDDAGYLQARIQVALHAAQHHLSGPGSTIDLHAILAGVTDASSAFAAIIELDTIGGTSQAPADSAMALVHDVDASSASLPSTAEFSWMLQTSESGSPGVFDFEAAEFKAAEFKATYAQQFGPNAGTEETWAAPEAVLIGETPPVPEYAL